MNSDHTQTPAGAVVVGFDGSENARPALVFAAEEAIRREAPLHVIYAFLAPRTWGAPMPPLNIERIRDAVLNRAREIIATVTSDLTITTEFHQDDPVTVLLDASTQASVVVVGARGIGGVQRALLGSVSQKVTARAVSPVIVVHGPPGDPAGPVVVGMDPNEESDQVMEYAFAEARRRNTGLLVVQARQHEPTDPRTIRDAGIGDYLNAAAEAAEGRGRELIDDWQTKYPDVPVTLQQLRGQASEAIIAAAKQGCVTVVGDHGRSGFAARVIGSVTQAVLYQVPVVAVVKITYDE